jgi:hypothetical protein
MGRADCRRGARCRRLRTAAEFAFVSGRDQLGSDSDYPVVGPVRDRAAGRGASALVSNGEAISSMVFDVVSGKALSHSVDSVVARP